MRGEAETNRMIAGGTAQKTLAGRSNLESAPARIHSAMVVTRPQVPEDDGYAISPELLSEKLHDSVKMIKELMSSNRKLKETIHELSNIKKTQEVEIAQLHGENQGLVEKFERSEGDASPFLKMQKEKEALVRRIAEMEKESRQVPLIFPIKERKNEWAWKSKRTIVRAGNLHTESPGQFIDKDRYQSVRPSTRGRVERSMESTRQISHNVSHDGTPDTRAKDDALSALSVLYSKTKVKKYGTFV